MEKRIIILTGHYGSGKSEVSVNLAMQSDDVDMLIDLDVINPYFRSREVEEKLTKKGIKVIGSTLKNSKGSDLPFISAASFQPIYNKNIKAIYDIGGDPAGAKVLRQYEQNLKQEDYDMYLVVNVFRPDTSNADEIIMMKQNIEANSGLKINGLINNSNFIRQTTIDDIIESQKIIDEVSSKLNIPVVYTTIWEKLLKDEKSKEIKGNLLPVKLYLRQNWL